MTLSDLLQIWALKNNQNSGWNFYETITLDERINKDVFIAEIIRVCGALTPVYNTTDSFVFFNHAFFEREKNVISRMLDTEYLKYSPIENFNRSEKVTHKTIGSTTLNEETVETGGNNNVSTFETSSYNSEDFEPNSKSVDDGQHTNTNSRDYTRNTDNDITETRDVSGLNGLASPQSLLKEERSVAEFNTITWLVAKYSKEMFYLVY